MAAHRQRAERVAVIALRPGNGPVSLRLADLQKILPGHLERRLDTLGSAGDEIHHVEVAGGCGDQEVGQLLHRLVAEEAGMGVGDRIELRLDGVDHPPLAMPEAGDRGRSEEHTSELQSLMRISYAVFCFKKKITKP